MENYKKLAKYGVIGLPYPKEYGGTGGDYLSYILAVEEVSKACGTTGIGFSVNTSLCCGAIYQNGTEDQKKKYLPDLCSGKKIGCFGLTEPNAGTDASAGQTIAVKDGDKYILNGQKCFITNAPIADVFVIFAMTDKSKGNKGISAFIDRKEYPRSEEHTSELQSRQYLVCRLLLEKKKQFNRINYMFPSSCNIPLFYQKM